MKRALTGKAKRSFVIFAAAVTTAVAERIYCGEGVW